MHVLQKSRHSMPYGHLLVRLRRLPNAARPVGFQKKRLLVHPCAGGKLKNGKIPLQESRVDGADAPINSIAGRAIKSQSKPQKCLAEGTLDNSRSLNEAENDQWLRSYLQLWYIRRMLH